MMKPVFRNKGKISYTIDEEVVLIKKLLRSVFGIIFVLTATVVVLQFFGPNIFSLFGLLSLDRFKKEEQPKVFTQTPFFAETPEYTKESKVDLHGFTESGSLVKVFVNGPQAQETTADSDGRFTFTGIELLDGQNIIFAKAQASNKEESEKSPTIYVNKDTKKPEIKISKPSNDETIESVDSRVQVIGQVNEDASVTVNKHLTIVDSEFNFKTLVSLKSGENFIIATAIDKAGNEATASVKVNFKKR